MANHNTIIGRIHSIGQTQNVSKKENAFYKRELVLNASRFDPYTGEERKNIITLTFAQKNCEKLDSFKAGDLVEVSFVLQGREYQPQTGGVKYITDVVGYNIVYHQTNTAQGTGNATQSPQPQAPVASAPVQPAPQTQTVSDTANGGGSDNLPF